MQPWLRTTSLGKGKALQGAGTHTPPAFLGVARPCSPFLACCLLFSLQPCPDV